MKSRTNHAMSGGMPGAAAAAASASASAAGKSCTNPGWLRVWWLAIRPATLWATVTPVVVGTAAAWRDGGHVWPVALSALAAAVFLQIGANLYNDGADYERGADTNARLGPARAVQQGWMSAATSRLGTAVAFGVALLCAGVMVWFVGWPVLGLGLVCMLGALAYSGGPYPLAYHGLGDLAVFVFFGLVAVLGTYGLQVGALTAWVWGPAASLGLLCTAILVVNNLRDRFSDGETGKRTLVVRFGAGAARLGYAALVLVPYLLVAWTSWQLQAWLVLAPWVSLPLALLTVRRLWRCDGAALNPVLAATARLEMVFGVLLAVGLVVSPGGW